MGRSIIAVIGIDRYLAWPRLKNAVGDATGVLRLFTQLGFVEVTSPLIDEAATCDAMRRLVTDDLAKLSPDDSLVLFFAGHGHTHTARFGDVTLKTGCVIPIDATPPRGHVSATWLQIDHWLRDIARLPPRHILVIIDACHSGVALTLPTWRDSESPQDDLVALQARRSRRVIASALDDQRAMDSGPVPGHSLFTGCLLEGLSGGLRTHGRRVATGRELGQYLQQRVTAYRHSVQTPDFGEFDLDDRGDIAIPIVRAQSASDEPTSSLPRSSRSSLWSALSDAWTAPLRFREGGSAIYRWFTRRKQSALLGPAQQKAEPLRASIEDTGPALPRPALHVDASESLRTSTTAHRPGATAWRRHATARRWPSERARAVSLGAAIGMAGLLAVRLYSGSDFEPTAQPASSPVRPPTQTSPPTSTATWHGLADLVEVNQPAEIEAVLNDGQFVQPRQIVVKLAGAAAIEAELDNLGRDELRLHDLIETATKRINLPGASHGQIAKGQAEIANRGKELDANKALRWTKREALEALLVRAPVAGACSLAVHVGDTVPAGSVVATIKHNEAKLAVASIEPFALGASVQVRIASSWHPIICEVIDIVSELVTVRCPEDRELVEGTRVTLRVPGFSPR